MDWLDLLAGRLSRDTQGTLKSLLQHHSSKASILQCSAFFIVQLSHPYMTTAKTIALTRWIFVGKVISLLFHTLSRLVITFLPRSKRLLILWLHSPSAVILEPKKLKSVQQVKRSFLFHNKYAWNKELLCLAWKKWLKLELGQGDFHLRLETQSYWGHDQHK